MNGPECIGRRRVASTRAATWSSDRRIAYREWCDGHHRPESAVGSLLPSIRRRPHPSVPKGADLNRRPENHPLRAHFYLGLQHAVMLSSASVKARDRRAMSAQSLALSDAAGIIEELPTITTLARAR